MYIKTAMASQLVIALGFMQVLTFSLFAQIEEILEV